MLHAEIFFANFLAPLRKVIHGSCRRHVTRCNLELKLTMDSKNSMQSLQKVKVSSTLCNLCKHKKIVKQVANRACYTLQHTRNIALNSIAEQVAKKIALYNTGYRARFHLQLLQRFFKTSSSCRPRSQRIFENIASCSPRLQRVTSLLQLVMDFFFQR